MLCISRGEDQAREGGAWVRRTCRSSRSCREEASQCFLETSVEDPILFFVPEATFLFTAEKTIEKASSSSSWPARQFVSAAAYISSLKRTWTLHFSRLQTRPFVQWSGLTGGSKCVLKFDKRGRSRCTEWRGDPPRRRKTYIMGCGADMCFNVSWEWTKAWQQNVSLKASQCSALVEMTLKTLKEVILNNFMTDFSSGSTVQIPKLNGPRVATC